MSYQLSALFENMVRDFSGKEAATLETKDKAEAQVDGTPDGPLHLFSMPLHRIIFSFINLISCQESSKLLHTIIEPAADYHVAHFSQQGFLFLAQWMKLLYSHPSAHHRFFSLRAF